jgi:hypothetical protein
VMMTMMNLLSLKILYLTKIPHGGALAAPPFSSKNRYNYEKRN